MNKKPKTSVKMRPPRTERRTPTLRFTPTAWAKLLFLRDVADTEVGGFGISASDDLLLIEDVRLVRQTCTWASVAFDDESVADFLDEQVDLGRAPQEVFRHWLHTHPGDCPLPSATDERTFDRVFGSSDWAVMFILAKEGQSYARLRFNVGPRADMEIPVSVDYSRPFGGCDQDAWEQEYLANVVAHEPATIMTREEMQTRLAAPFGDEVPDEWLEAWQDYAQHDNPKGLFL